VSEPTPNPSVAEMLGAMSSHTGRISLAQDEIIRRLRELLPDLIAAHNQAEGYAPNRGVQMPAIEPGPAVLTDSFLKPAHVGKLLVSASVSTDSLGIGGTYINEGVITISCIDAPIEVGHQMKIAFERIELVRGVLYPFMNDCVDLKGRRVWQLLEPRGYSALPGTITKFSGTQARFRLLQTPGDNGLWATG
jgi:hypothetical protein